VAGAPYISAHLKRGSEHDLIGETISGECFISFLFYRNHCGCSMIAVVPVRNNKMPMTYACNAT
jgi:hypothetical protein